VRGEIRECSAVLGLVMDLAFRRSGLKQPVARKVHLASCDSEQREAPG
jgi:hypothetical protein